MKASRILWDYQGQEIKAIVRHRSTSLPREEGSIQRHFQHSLRVDDSPHEWPVLHQRSDSHLAFDSHGIPHQLYSSQSAQRASHSQSGAHRASMLPSLPSYVSLMTLLLEVGLFFLLWIQSGFTSC